MVAEAGIKEEEEVDISNKSHRQLRALEGKRKLKKMLHKKVVQKIKFKIVKYKVLNVFGALLDCKFCHCSRFDYQN